MVHELGVWAAYTGAIVPGDAKWVVAMTPSYGNPELFYNPDFELGLYGWKVSTNANLVVYTQPGYVGNSAVMVNDELVFGGGIMQRFRDVPPNTTFHFKAMVKTVDIEALRTRLLIFTVQDYNGNWLEGAELGYIEGSNDWTLYEGSYTTPNQQTRVDVSPASVYGRGEVWLDDVSLTMEGWRSSTTPAILNFIEIHNSQTAFVTEADLNEVEDGLKTVPIQNFWGILFIREEHNRNQIAFGDTVNTTWFGENLLGYPLYLAEAPGATIDDWMDEMFLRMLRGFYNYFSPLTKVGIIINAGSTIVGYQYRNGARGIPKFWGIPAINFLSENYDFVILYAYTTNLQAFNDWTKPYYDVIDQFFTKQKKFWIISNSREVSSSFPIPWEPEAMALEMKNAFDRNIVLMAYTFKDPTLEESWSLMLNARDLYNARAPYTESIVNDTNLLTGQVGDTYGWVADPAHDEELYPTPISPIRQIAPLAFIAGVLYFLGKKPNRRR